MMNITRNMSIHRKTLSSFEHGTTYNVTIDKRQVVFENMFLAQSRSNSIQVGALPDMRKDKSHVKSCK